MADFDGFPSGKVRYTAIPDLFFSAVLPEIDNLAELKVTLHVFWRLQRKSGDSAAVPRPAQEPAPTDVKGHGSGQAPLYIGLSELLADRDLMAGLAGVAATAEQALRDGLARAVERRTLLQIDVAGPDGTEPWFLPNTERGRRILDQIERGELEVRALSPRPAAQPVAHPNIFTLYEQTVGLFSPLLRDELLEAEQQYPPGWIAEAFKIAAENNVRKWTYVRAILERWATEGKDDGTNKRRTEEDPDRYLKGKYAPFIRH